MDIITQKIIDTLISELKNNGITILYKKDLNIISSNIWGAVIRELGNSGVNVVKDKDIIDKAIKKVVEAFICELRDRNIKVVKNMEGSSKYVKPRNFETWIEFWATKANKDIPECGSECGCCGKVQEKFVGGHVIAITDGSQYIYPICESCNSTYGEGKKNDHTFEGLKESLVPFNEDDAECVDHQ